MFMLTFKLLILAQLPRLERVLDLSIMGLLLRTDLLAKDRSAVTRVIEILRTKIDQIN